MEHTIISLYHEFQQIIQTGTEEQARQFLLDHINEFPEDVKNGLILTFFEDALNEEVSQESAMLEFKKEGIKAMTALEQAIRILDDKLKVLDLQEKIQ